MQHNSVRWDRIHASGKEYTPIDSTILGAILSRITEMSECSPSRALDIGCGTGGLVLQLACRGIETIGIDISNVALAIAGKRASLLPSHCIKPEFIQAGFETADLGGPFDVIFMKLVLPFIGDLGAALQRARNLLASRGVLVIITPVRRARASYSEHMRSISVDKEELESHLRATFSSFEEFRTRNIEDSGVEGTYLAPAFGNAPKTFGRAIH